MRPRRCRPARTGPAGSIAGVAMNVAAALRRQGLRPALLAHVGFDTEGEALIRAAAGLGVETGLLTRLPDLPTDLYLAIEGPEGLVAAIADAAGLEAAGAAILAPLSDGRLAAPGRPWSGVVALDGNLSAELLTELAGAPELAAADLRLAPASPGKAGRLAPLRRHPNATLYVNLEEAGLLLGAPASAAVAAAAALVEAGWRRALVTDGPREAGLAAPGFRLAASPPAVEARRVTGAGDACLAAHIAAERNGLGPAAALEAALAAAARHVSEAP